MGGDKILYFRGRKPISLASLAREVYRSIRCHATSHAHMSEILGDMLNYATGDQTVKDLVILMVMIHRDEKKEEK